MELKHYAMFARRWWLLLGACAIVGLIIGFLMSAKAPMYSSTATLIIGSRPTRNTPNTDALRANASLSKTYSALMTTRPVMEEVIRNLGLNTSPGLLTSQIEVKYIDDTDLIKLTAESPDKQQAVAIANETVAAFNRQASTILSNPYTQSIDAVRVIEEAQSAKPVPNDTMRNVLLMTLLGLLLAIGVGTLFDYFDDRVRDSAKVAQLVGLPTLAAIPHIRGGEQNRLVAATDSASPTAESFRMVRSAITPIGAPAVGSLVVTSANRAEGKSTVAANLAAAMAQTGLRVVLVDADLRKPTLHTLFGRSNSRGLTTALARQRGDSLATHVVSTNVERLQLMPSGPLPATPAEVFGTPRFAELISDLQEQADLIILDSPSLLAVVDPLLIAQATDATLMVARSNGIHAATLVQAITKLRQSSPRVLGVVLNQAAHASAATNNNYDGGRGIRAFQLRPVAKPSMATIEGAEIVDHSASIEQH